MYKIEENKNPYVTKGENESKVVRQGNAVHVYMTSIRSHFSPDNIEGIKLGDDVYFHVTNLEQDWDVPHGFAVKGANNAELLIMPGETATLKWTPDKVGIFPIYCTDFCSALHQEMQGYVRVSPKGSSVPISFSLGKNSAAPTNSSETSSSKELKDLKIVINGAGAAGVAIAKLLRCVDYGDMSSCIPAKEIILCDSRGILNKDRTDLNEEKRKLLVFSNPNNLKGGLLDALVGADVFIGVSQGDLLVADDIKLMNKDAIVFALANPTPEIMPDQAHRGGAAIVGTGRSDLPNQVNNVLGFPGIFRGALDAKAKKITPEMKIAAAHAIASFVKNPTHQEVIPSSLSREVADAVAKAVKEAALKEMENCLV